MRILSFDIGIINMAYCLIDTVDQNSVGPNGVSIKIIDWGILDISGISACSMCKKKAKAYVVLTNRTTDDKSYYCASHCKNYAEKHFASKDIKKIKDTADMDLDYLGTNLYILLEKLGPIITDNIDTILFENQPVLKNPKMKSIQMMLYSYFLMKKSIHQCSITTLKFYTAKRKLEIKGLQTDTSAFDKKEYSDRKKMSKVITLEILKRMNDFIHISQLENADKQDDLCDCFIQGVEHIQTQQGFNIFTPTSFELPPLN